MRKTSLKGVIGVAVLVTAIAMLSLLAASGAPPAGQPPVQPWDMYLLGGPGNQWGFTIAVRNSQLFVGGVDWDILHGRLRSYELPLSPTYQWDLSPWGETFYGLAATDTNLFVVGDAQPPACGAVDCAGDVEGKTFLGKYASGGTSQGCWSTNFFPYCGGEHYSAAACSNEGGIDYIYALGFGEQMGWLHSIPFYLTKYDTGGTMINKVTEPGLGWGWPPAYGIGGYHAYGIVILNGYIYCAGASRLHDYIYGEDSGTWEWGLRPVLMKYDFNLIRQWKVRDNIAPPYPGYSGEFRGVTALDNAIYAVGGAIPTGGTGGLDFLVEKFDEFGTRIWSVSWGGPYEDFLNGVVAVGGRLFAVGYIYETADTNETTGEADAVLFEISPVDGSILMNTAFGGARVDKANGIATDGHDLYIVGSTRSYASAEGNSVGQNEIMLIHYRLNRAPVADGQSINADGGVTLNIDLSASDEDNDDLTYSVVSGPFHGSLTGTAPNLAYTAPSSYWGPDEFTFKANDGKEDSNVATVTIAVNHVPVAVGLSVSTPENMSAAILLGAAMDVDEDELIYTVLSGPAHGLLTGSAPNLTYAPTEYYYGPDSFTFQISDGKALSNIATVLVTVKRVFAFTGFTQPIDNEPTVNSAKSGSAIPVKWRITDLDGTPISDPASFNNLTSYSIGCSALAGDAVDEVETYAGTSGLQYFGDGNWQFNWKTTKSYLNQCRRMVLTLADGSTHTAYFRFN